MNIGEGKYIKLLFITRQNFLHNDRSGGYKLSQNIFQSLKENDGIEVSLCILDINGCKISKKLFLLLQKADDPSALTPVLIR